MLKVKVCNRYNCKAIFESSSLASRCPICGGLLRRKTLE